MRILLYVITGVFIALTSLAYGSGLTTEEIQKKAEEGDKGAQLLLGYIYEKGNDDVKQDYKKALEWYTKAAAKGEALAQTRIGLMYYKGNGVKQDYAKAFEWFSKAGKQGNSEAQAVLGIMYYTGKGVKQDNKKAIEWLTKAAKQGHYEAKTMIGTMYANGELKNGGINTSSAGSGNAKLNNQSPEESNRINAARIDRTYDDIFNIQADLIQVLDQLISDINDTTQTTKQVYERTMQMRQQMQYRGYSF